MYSLVSIDCSPYNVPNWLILASLFALHVSLNEVCSSFKGEHNATLKHTGVSHYACDFCHHIHVPYDINCLRARVIGEDFCIHLLYSNSCGYGIVWINFAGFSISGCDSFLYHEMEVSRASVRGSVQDEKGPVLVLNILLKEQDASNQVVSEVFKVALFFLSLLR